VTGVLTLVRDVSDIRQLNRMVLNKDAAVREVHHRVKNNLQTISSLLRLQARRSEEEETRTALLRGGASCAIDCRGARSAVARAG
jgi:two-component sensor histidine kinase